MRQRLFRLTMWIRKRMPSWFDRWLLLLLRSDNAVGRFMKNLIAGAEQVPAPVLPESSARVRVLVAPFNYAAQGHHWTRTLNEADVKISAINYAVLNGRLDFPADLQIPVTAFLGSQEWKNRLREALPSYSHILIESFGSIYGRGTGRVILKEIDELREHGVKVGLLCHGSDIRSPDAFVARNPSVRLSDFGDGVQKLRRDSSENLAVLREFEGDVFVSTPDLLHDVPHAKLLPVVVDPIPWQSAASQSLTTNTIPLVVHVPSNVGIKGSDHINRAGERLQQAGIIRYRQLTGVSPASMPNVIAEADIVIDQMLLGSYGVAACEAMAAGKTVVGNVFTDVREIIAQEAQIDLPIVQADISSLEAVLKELAGSCEQRMNIGVASRTFVERMHAGSRTLPALARFLELT